MRPYDHTAQLILTDDGRELARAYTRIAGRSARQALIAIARELSGPGPGPMDRGVVPGSERAAAKAPD
jgi:hypothetical protein